MPVDNIKKRALHKTALHLDPTVWVGKNGITENVIKEIICALEDHELIKIKMLGFLLLISNMLYYNMKINIQTFKMSILTFRSYIVGTYGTNNIFFFMNKFLLMIHKF